MRTLHGAVRSQRRGHGKWQWRDGGRAAVTGQEQARNGRCRARGSGGAPRLAYGSAREWRAYPWWLMRALRAGNSAGARYHTTVRRGAERAERKILTPRAQHTAHHAFLFVYVTCVATVCGRERPGAAPVAALRLSLSSARPSELSSDASVGLRPGQFTRLHAGLDLEVRTLNPYCTRRY